MAISNKQLVKEEYPKSYCKKEDDLFAVKTHPKGIVIAKAPSPSLAWKFSWRKVDQQRVKERIEVRGTKLEPICRMYWFWCPGCDHPHAFRVEISGTPIAGPSWTFNNDLVSPTFAPSLLVQGSKRCHFFVREGIIHYCSDCEHDLLDKKVRMKPFRDHQRESASGDGQRREETRRNGHPDRV